MLRPSLMITVIGINDKTAKNLVVNYNIREGDEVLVVGAHAIATGRAALPAVEMLRLRRGVDVCVRKVKRV